MAVPHGARLSTTGDQICVLKFGLRCRDLHRTSGRADALSVREGGYPKPRFDRRGLATHVVPVEIVPDLIEVLRDRDS